MSPTTASPQAQPHGVAFTATDIASAVSQIRATLGPEAVLLNIRRVGARGLSKLWVKPQIEVLACLPQHAPHSAVPAPAPGGAGLPPTGSDPRCGAGVPPAGLDPRCGADFPPADSDPRCGAGFQPAAPDAASPDLLSQPRTTTHTAIQRYTQAHATPLLPDLPVADFAPPTAPVDPLDLDSSSPWRVASVLHRLGLTPLHAQRVLDTVQRLHEPHPAPPPSLAHELALARSAFRQLWRAAPPANPTAPPPLHVLVGPPGSGKSTVLCKWLAQTVLVEGQSARVWRLDARAPNTAELVSLYGEILNVPVERSWNGRGAPPVIGFVDLPGTDFHDASALAQLTKLLATLPNPAVHLVLNAAYTVPLLLAQARAFASFPGTDLILTHLDEEPAWGKLWNLVLGTNCPLRFLSAGQNIPGRFLPAQPDLLSPALFEPN